MQSCIPGDRGIFPAVMIADVLRLKLESGKIPGCAPDIGVRLMFGSDYSAGLYGRCLSCGTVGYFVVCALYIFLHLVAEVLCFYGL